MRVREKKTQNNKNNCDVLNGFSKCAGGMRTWEHGAGAMGQCYIFVFRIEGKKVEKRKA